MRFFTKHRNSLLLLSLTLIVGLLIFFGLTKKPEKCPKLDRSKENQLLTVREFHDQQVLACSLVKLQGEIRKTGNSYSLISEDSSIELKTSTPLEEGTAQVSGIVEIEEAGPNLPAFSFVINVQKIEYK